jgi:hypothetical protein
LDGIDKECSIGCLIPKYKPPGKMLVTSMLFNVIFADVITSTKFVVPDGNVMGVAALMYRVV